MASAWRGCDHPHGRLMGQMPSVARAGDANAGWGAPYVGPGHTMKSAGSDYVSAPVMFQSKAATDINKTPRFRGRHDKSEGYSH